MDLYRRGDRLLFLSLYMVFFDSPWEKKVSGVKCLSLVKGRKGGEGREGGGGGGGEGVITASLAFHRARRSSPGKDVKSVEGEL